jgi:hypothetical protein
VKKRIFGLVIPANILGTGIIDKLIQEKKHFSILVFITLLLESHRLKEKRYMEEISYFSRKLNVTQKKIIDAIKDINFYSKNIDFLDKNLTFIPSNLLKSFASPDTNYNLYYNDNNNHHCNHNHHDNQNHSDSDSDTEINESDTDNDTDNKNKNKSLESKIESNAEAIDSISTQENKNHSQVRASEPESEKILQMRRENIEKAKKAIEINRLREAENAITE